MLKNNKGITLGVLVVTIIIMLILAGTTIATSNLLLRDTKQKTIVANMYIIKAEVESIYDEYQFSEEDDTVLVGEVAYDLSDYGITITSGVDLWYVWNKDTLSSLGLDPTMLKGDTTFIVNYATGEVAYSAGCVDEDGNIEYTLTDIVD